MSGHPDQQMLALWAGGDLDPDNASRVRLHLENCRDCGRMVEEIEKAQDILRSSFEEPAEVDLQSLRLGVARSLDRRRRAVLWCWSFGSAAALALVFLCVMPGRTPVTNIAEQEVQLHVLPAPVHFTLEIPDVKRMARPRSKRALVRGEPGLRAVNFVQRADGSTELKLTTSDRNVVILLPPLERTIEQ